MSILSGQAIVAARNAGQIEIDPFNAEQVNPVSYDLTLGDKVLVYKDWDQPCHGSPLVVDSKVKEHYLTNEITMLKQGFILKPGHGYLMHTRERVWTDRYVPIVDGKSSWARLFVAIHVTAGFGDPGFKGNYTLEVTCTYPIVIYPGCRIAQIRFHTIEGDITQYNGSYVGSYAEGPVASRAWRQFE